MPMTFEQFQATRTHSDDLAKTTGIDMGFDIPVPGNVYCGPEGFYIQARNSAWTDEAKARGAWHLLIEREEWISDDLTDLERKLYEWARDEEYLPQTDEG